MVRAHQLDSSYASDSKQLQDVWGNEKTRETLQATGTRESLRRQLMHGNPFDYLQVSKVKEEIPLSLMMQTGTREYHSYSNKKKLGNPQSANFKTH